MDMKLIEELREQICSVDKEISEVDSEIYEIDMKVIYEEDYYTEYELQELNETIKELTKIKESLERRRDILEEDMDKEYIYQLKINA